MCNKSILLLYSADRDKFLSVLDGQQFLYLIKKESNNSISSWFTMQSKHTLTNYYHVWLKYSKTSIVANWDGLYLELQKT